MKRTASAKKKSNANGISTKRRTAGKSRRRRDPEFAVCVDNSGYPASLELHKIYRLIADDDALESGDLRVVDESGEDYLYPARRFVQIEIPKRVGASLLRAASRMTTPE